VTDTPFSPAELDAAMVRAAKDGDIVVFVEALDSGANANALDPDTGRNLFYTLLDIVETEGAAPKRGNYYAMLMGLTTRGADVNFRDKDGISPLHYALQRENYLVADVLIAMKADANEHFPPAGDTPLHIAVRLALAGQGVRLLDTLLAFKADPLLKNNAGVSSLDLLHEFAAAPEDFAAVRDKLAATPHALGEIAATRAAQQDELRQTAKRFKLRP